MKPNIASLDPVSIVGIKTETSFAENKTAELWRTFMPRRSEIRNRKNEDLYSISIYKPGFFLNFHPNVSFEKWAGVEVQSSEIREGWESLRLPGGLYASFLYKGLPRDASGFFERIFRVWLPASEYLLDDRPHFEVMGESYKNDDPDSEESVFIPIRKR
ncbi:GyrI-like domain-containing protein [Leptospira ellisii]|uniref:GyrI-like domain-containing protein n=1 Tax=Leptospira ellisii TaxID=2023197 RepID=A0A2N0BBK8_9LEPT|nr:GyrI-like domain-containing protein [Leptospira ellisii]MDV6236819.1 GyrI-like domain-containing protein [Leptospira ellisii]PJZ93905.1 hypothetical protein CH379_05355 [Leptospira ellisii]